MRSKRLTLLLIGLLTASLLVTLTPTATALTFTTISTLTTDSTQFDQTSLVAVSADLAFVARAKIAASDLIVSRCSSSGCLDTTVDSSSTAITQPRIHAVSATELFACYEGSTAGVPRVLFVRSANAGATWSTPSIIQTDAGGFESVDCAWTGTAFLAVYSKTASSGFYRTTTDNGASWSTEDGVGTRGQHGVHATNATIWTVLTNIGPATTERCRTTNAGADFTCTNPGLGESRPETGIGSFSPQIFGVASTTTTTVTIGESIDAGQSFSVSQAATDTDVSFASMNRFTDDSIATTYGKSSATTQPCLYTQTTDGYLTWDAPAALFTLGAVTTASNVAPNIDEAAGVVWIACSYQPNGGANREVRVLSATFATGTTGSSATAPFTDLTGFDVSPNGNTVVVRTDGGDFVRVRDAVTLTGGGNFETDCSAVDRVFAAYVGDLIGFVDCEPGGGADNMIIRTRQMTVPTDEDLNGCDQGETCDTEIDLDGLSDDADDAVQQLNQVRQFPINYSSRDVDFFQGFFHAAWGFSGQVAGAGRVGFVLFSASFGADDFRVRSVNYPSGGGAAQEFCVGLDGSQYYLAAVDDSDSTYVWPVVFDSDDVADATFGSPMVAAGTFAQGRGVACSASTVAVWTTTGTFLIDRASGSQTHAFTHDLDTDVRGVAMSDTFTIPSNCGCDFAGDPALFVAYKDDTLIRVVEAITETEVATIDVPTGDWVGIKMDRTAQNVWVATDTQVVRFDIHLTTTGVPVSPQGGSPPVTMAPGDGLSGAGVALGSGLGIGTFGGNLFSAVIVIGMFSYGMWEDGQKQKLWAIIGAFLGFLSAWAFGFLTTGGIFAIIVFAAIIFYVSNRMRG